MRARSTIGVLAAAAVAAGLLVAPSGIASAETSPRPLVSGWFGWWAADASITAMTSEADGVVGQVAMFWWTFQGKDTPLCLFDNGDYDKDGNWGDPLCNSATPWTTPKFDRQRKALQAAGIKINASITDLGSATARQLTDYLSTAKRRTAYAEQIADYAQTAGVDGVDLDWENFAFNDGRDTWEATKPRWVEFIKVLSEKLHEKGLTLWATVPGGVPPFTGTGTPNPGTGYWVYAWSEIAPYVDRLNIMTYDYSWSVPGPIGPNDWARLVAQSAVAQIGEKYADRVWIGAPQYGRNWPLVSGGSWIVDEACPEGWKPKDTPARTTLTPTVAREIAAREKVEPQWNAEDGEWSFQYWQDVAGKANKKDQACKIKREVWFADTRSALARASIVPEEGIGGIAVWDFGTVTPDFYSRLADYGREIAPSPTTVAVKAPKSVVAGAQVRIRVSTDSRKGPAGGAEATLFFKPAAGGADRAKVDTITLDGDGTGAFKVAVDRPGEWTVEVAGSSTRQAGTSAPVAIAVRYAVSAQATTTTPKVKTPVTLTATVAPASAGLSVALQKQAPDGSWATLRTLVTDASGMVSASVRPTMVKKVSYRFEVAATDQYGMGRS
ncbi:MAG: glycosyl hydrolase family 18 protein, partial [Ilumatobacteraceae bacterium]